MNESKGIVDESRAYQLARELSLLGINGHCSGHGQGTETDHSLPIPPMEFEDRIQSGHLNLNLEPNDCIPQDINLVSGLNESNGVFPGGASCNNRKSANMTETVPVPSSEHVAEIVGRQGCKIKALRAKTNTYIKTPVRGEEPMFVVTGRQEDVARAKHEILSAAEHFSQIRASRRTAASSQTNGSGTCSPVCVPGHVTIQVRVPYKVVGLVVGPKGATIKRIQQATSTYIVTPGRDKEPVFEVTGLPDSVERAREEIEKHIASRTGTDNNSDLQIDDFNVNGIDSGFHDHTSSDSTNTNGSEMYGNFSSKGSMNGGHDSHLSVITSHPSTAPYHQHQQQFMGGSSSSCSMAGGCRNGGGGPVRSCSCCSSGPVRKTHSYHRHTTDDMNHSSFAIADYPKMYNNSSFHSFNHMMINCRGGSSGNSDQFDVDEGIGASGGSIFDPSAAAIWGNDASSFSIQRSNSIGVASVRILPPGEDCPHPRTRRTNSDPLAAAFQAAFSSSSRSSSQASTSPVTGRRNNERLHTSTVASTNSSSATPTYTVAVGQCVVCGCVDTVASTATLMPCGHNSFCIKCASDICQRAASCANDSACPVCRELPAQPLTLHHN